MSTRGVIAKPTGDGTWTGVYHHFDSYPSHLGQTLWLAYHNDYATDGIAKMHHDLIDAHPQGWSIYPERPYPDSDPTMVITNDTVEPLFHEWIYVLHDDHLEVLTGCFTGDTKDIGAIPSGSSRSSVEEYRAFIEANYGVIHVVDVPWSGYEPNWDDVERMRHREEEDV